MANLGSSYTFLRVLRLSCFSMALWRRPSPGCSDGRFNAPSEGRKAGETARTLHHLLQLAPRPRFPDAVLLRQSDQGFKQQTTPRPVRTLSMLRASTCQTNPWRHLMWSYFAHEAPIQDRSCAHRVGPGGVIAFAVAGSQVAYHPICPVPSSAVPKTDGPAKMVAICIHWIASESCGSRLVPTVHRQTTKCGQEAELRINRDEWFLHDEQGQVTINAENSRRQFARNRRTYAACGSPLAFFTIHSRSRPEACTALPNRRSPIISSSALRFLRR